MKRRIAGIILSFALIFGMLLSFAPTENAYAISIMTLKEPVETETYMAGTPVPIVISPQMYNIAMYNSYAQVEILRNGKRVFFENIEYYDGQDISPESSFIPSEGGTYTIKLGAVFTNDAPPDEIYRLQETKKFKVMGGGAVRKIVPALICKRNSANRPTLTCTNSLGGQMQMKVYRAEKKSGKFKLIDTVAGNEYTDQSSMPLKTYYYKVKLSLKLGSKTYTSKFSSVKGSIPARPEIIYDRTSKGKVILKCTNKPGGVKMQVYRAASKSGKYKLIKTTGKASFTDKDTKAKKAYFYKVRLTKKSGKKKYSSKYSAVLKAEKSGSGADPSVLGVKVVNTSSGVKITWTKYSKAGYYLVSRGTSSNKEGEVFDCLEEVTCYDKEAVKGKTYYYTVSAWYGNDTKALVTSKPVKIVVK